MSARVKLARVLHDQTASTAPPASQPFPTPADLTAPAPRPGAVLPPRPAVHTTRTATRARAWTRRVHALVGIVSALNLLLLLATGMLLQHREAFRLDERMVSRKMLPRSYRPQDGDAGVRADIVATELHSGRLLGQTGALVLDGITLGWFALLSTGLVMYAAGRRRNRNGETGNGSAGGYAPGE